MRSGLRSSSRSESSIVSRSGWKRGSMSKYSNQFGSGLVMCWYIVVVGAGGVARVVDGVVTLEVAKGVIVYVIGVVIT